MKKKKNDEEIINYRLEKINKIKKKPGKKGFARFFDEKNNSINASNIDNGSMSSKIFNKSGNKKNVTLRMLDFEQDYPNQMNMEQNEEANSRIKYLSFLFYIICFIIYKQSLFSCENISLNECIEKYDINIVINCLIKCISSGFILSANLAFIYWKFLSAAHIFLLLIFMITLLLVDYGNNIYNHGLINFTILLISLFFGFFFFIILQAIISYIIQKNFKVGGILMIIIFACFLGFYFISILLTSCSYWGKGLKSISIDNDKNKYSCKFAFPSKCYMFAFDNAFDFSKMIDYNCNKLPNQLTYGEVLENYNLYFDTQFEDDISVLNFPLTNNANFSGEHLNSDNNFAKKVISNVKGTKEKDFNNSEIFLVRNGKDGIIEMKIKKNNNLIEQNKKLAKSSNKIRNILFFYFDSLSRQQIHRKLKDFSSLFSELFNEAHANYESFEFFKYHTFDNYNHQSTQAIFYGVDSLYNNYKNNENKPMNILSHLKQNGYITAQTANICSKHLSSPFHNLFTEEFDHENIGMFCDPSYSMINQKNFNIKGIHSSLKRCIYGKESFEYIINYGKMFWDTYPENNKFLRMGFYDNSERSGEVVKYLDEHLSDFILNIINEGKFRKSIIILVSGTGEIEAGIYDRNVKSEYYFEKNLGSWFILLNKNGLDKEIIQKMRNNQQNFVTPYDVYDTMLSIIYDCYDQNCFEKISHKSINGNSIFMDINGKERNCEKYKEIRPHDCHCIKY